MFFSEIGTLLQTVGNLFKVHEDNTKSLVLLNDAQIEYLTSSIADTLMFFYKQYITLSNRNDVRSNKALTDKVSKAEK